jgi:uncharacterized protein (DUF433 family)
MKRIFTIEQDKEVAELYQQGMSSIKLAEQYGVDKSTVLGALKRQGIRRRTNRAFTRGEEQQIAHIYQAGHKITDIAKAYGYDFTTIKNALKRQGVKQGDDRFTFSATQEKEILEEYKSGNKMADIAKKYQASPGTISKAITNQGGKVRDGRIFTDSEEVMIGHIYESGFSPQQISVAYGVSRSAIINTIDRRGIDKRPNRKNFFDEKAFDSLDSEAPLYWLGFCYADANVTNYELRIGLAIKDIDHLQLLGDFMQSDKTVKKYRNNTACQLSFASVYLTKRLHSLGLIAGRGEFEKLVPHIPDNLAHHFIRGYLDGDGCITESNYLIRFLGQVDILEWIRNILHSNAGASNSVSIKKRRGIYSIGWGGRYQGPKIIDYLYKNATIYLDRKRKVARSWK